MDSFLLRTQRHSVPLCDSHVDYAYGVLQRAFSGITLYIGDLVKLPALCVVCGVATAIGVFAFEGERA